MHPSIKWSRFHRETRLPKDTNMNEISTKLLSPGVLAVVIPRKTRKWEAIKEVPVEFVALVVLLVAAGIYVACVVNRRPLLFHDYSFIVSKLNLFFNHVP